MSQLPPVLRSSFPYNTNSYMQAPWQHNAERRLRRAQPSTLHLPAASYLTLPLLLPPKSATAAEPLERCRSSSRLRKAGTASRTASMSPVYGISSTCQRTLAQKSVPTAVQLLHSAALRSASVQELVAAQVHALQPIMDD